MLDLDPLKPLSYYSVKNLLFILIGWVVLGCADSEAPFEPTYEVPEELIPFVESFFQEAQSRGFVVTQDNLIIRYGDQREQGICGHCNSLANLDQQQKIVTITAPDQFCWNNRQQLEALIFHELGHCLLNRTHHNATLPNGDPASLMVENSISQYSPCIYQINDDEDCNFTFKRDYYLDELFEPTTAIPLWAQD